MTTIAERVAAYLDGDLVPAEARALEREFLRPEVSQALAEELALRELLGSLPSAEPPADLEARIVATLGVAERRTLRERLFGGRSKAQPRDEGTSRTPNYAAAGLRAGASSWVAGLGTLRYLVAPISGASARDEAEEATPKQKRRAGRGILGAAVFAYRAVTGVPRQPVVRAAASTYRAATGLTRQPLLARALRLGRAR